MSIARTNFDDISEADLNDLVLAGVPEGLVIEYKRDPYGSSDADKKEALKDITSFANSAGGHLVIGMEETKGIPTRVAGLPGVNPDALINRLESLVRDGVEPRIVGVRMRPISLSSGIAVLVIRIPRSWNPPHRVSAARTNRFYVRNSGGAHEASVEELRVLFTRAADAQQRINTFRSDRLATIVAGCGPVPIRTPSNGRLIVHLVPLSAFGQTTQVDLEIVQQCRRKFLPIGESSVNNRFNLDGFISIHSGNECNSYTQIFRNGIVEATKANIMYIQNGDKFIYLSITKEIIERVPLYLDGLQMLDVPAPIVCMVSFQDVGGAKLVMGNYIAIDKVHPFPWVEPLLLPEVILDDYGLKEDYAKALRPILDALWERGWPSEVRQLRRRRELEALGVIRRPVKLGRPLSRTSGSEMAEKFSNQNPTPPEPSEATR